jgi:gluconokinase
VAAAVNVERPSPFAPRAGRSAAPVSEGRGASTRAPSITLLTATARRHPTEPGGWPATDGGGARPAMRDEVVLGVDIGTTATKVVAVDASGALQVMARAGYPLEEPRPGEAVQRPEAILAAVTRTVAEAAAASRRDGRRVAALCLGSAMHSLLAVDGEGRPLTPSITWADGRADDEAERLRATPEGHALQRRTGTPIHPMSPLVKLLWFRAHAPEVAAAARHWMGVKEYVLTRLTGDLVMDHSLASGTGLLRLATLDWDPDALSLCGIDAAQLPAPVPTTTVLRGLRPAVAAELGLDPAVAIVVGAGDGPLANLGTGAVRAGVAACSIGTSGATRVAVEGPTADQSGRLFCYALTERRWVVGGALNNGGVVLRWARDALAPEMGDGAEDALLAVAAGAPAGSRGLVMLPSLFGERAPHRSALARGAYVGLTHVHRREHLVRAALEGVCLQMAIVLDTVRAAGHAVREVRATGGFARSPMWRQLLTDVLGVEVGFPAGSEGTGRGAGLLGLVALGRLDGLDAASDLVGVEEVRRPDPGAAAVYADLRPVVDSLYEALAPTFARLRGIDRGGGAVAAAQLENGAGGGASCG